MSKLLISDLRLWVSLGCLEQEKCHTQCVSFDIGVTFIDPPKGTYSDHLEDSLCYAKIIDVAKDTADSKKYNLIEHLASSVHRAISASMKEKNLGDNTLSVKVTKLSPPVADLHGGVSFTYCGQTE
ncbi:dihydroneopterin aldolase [Rickettsiaceae bacterium]|nr:dihydroneopterin aldolase [Rickettsiaceae bacterium]